MRLQVAEASPWDLRPGDGGAPTKKKKAGFRQEPVGHGGATTGCFHRTRATEAWQPFKPINHRNTMAMPIFVWLWPRAVYHLSRSRLPSSCDPIPYPSFHAKRQASASICRSMIAVNALAPRRQPRAAKMPRVGTLMWAPRRHTGDATGSSRLSTFTPFVT